jgi:hypothetical protein
MSVIYQQIDRPPYTWDEKVFSFTRQPTGNDIMAVIFDNSLGEWEVTLEKFRTENYGGLATLNPYRWELRYRKVTK